jgi:hypothetical protein
MILAVHGCGGKEDLCVFEASIDLNKRMAMLAVEQFPSLLTVGAMFALKAQWEARFRHHLRPLHYVSLLSSVMLCCCTTQRSHASSRPSGQRRTMASSPEFSHSTCWSVAERSRTSFGTTASAPLGPYTVMLASLQTRRYSKPTILKSCRRLVLAIGRWTSFRGNVEQVRQ